MDDLGKIDYLQKQVTEHLTNMKRWQRKSVKNQKRSDDLQKEKDQRTGELTKQTSMKEKLEKLCRELQKENNKLKVRTANSWALLDSKVLIFQSRLITEL